MRPTSLENYIGQSHLTGVGAVLRRAIESGQIPSMILWGPPGVGKTTLAGIIAAQVQRPFHALSAIHAGVKDIRETIDKAKSQRFFNAANPILFIDEIHRFSKSQQDALLGAVEKGVVTLIGATTENPSFEVIPALLSRSQVYVLQPLTKEELLALIQQALTNDDYLKQQNIELVEYEALLHYSGGDGRRLLNTLELVTLQTEKATGDVLKITNTLVTNTIQQNIALYDKTGEQHYDIISAFIKSIRGTDPDAAIYYLARMLEGGEDIAFIARRLIILASEDIGLANPNALLMATTCQQAIHTVGMPESRIILAQTVLYLATSPKSNTAYVAIEAALATVRKTGGLPVPLHLRNAPTPLMKSLDYGKNYKYAHNFEQNYANQAHLPESLIGTTFYTPGNNPPEDAIKKRLEELKRAHL
jgi:putative ATPase